MNITLTNIGLKSSNTIEYCTVYAMTNNSLYDARISRYWANDSHSAQITTLNSSGASVDIPIVFMALYR